VLCGVLLLDKPVGLSSNAALQRVRRLLSGVKAGHTGSLDPLASGMLPICLGEATKLAGELLAGDKAYSFRVVLGVRTSTGDAEGEVMERHPVPPLGRERIAAELAARLGESLQVPPMYSALKRQGGPGPGAPPESVGVNSRCPPALWRWWAEATAGPAGRLLLGTLRARAGRGHRRAWAPAGTGGPAAITSSPSATSRWSRWRFSPGG
jgi:hypothetical protein